MLLCDYRIKLLRITFCSSVSNRFKIRSCSIQIRLYVSWLRFLELMLFIIRWANKCFILETVFLINDVKIHDIKVELFTGMSRPISPGDEKMKKRITNKLFSPCKHNDQLSHDNSKYFLITELLLLVLKYVLSP